VETEITDAGLKDLTAIKTLHTLALGGPNVTNAGLTMLAQITTLQDLTLTYTNVTNVGITKFEQVLPDCHVHVYHYRDSLPSSVFEPIKPALSPFERAIAPYPRVAAPETIAEFLLGRWICNNKESKPSLKSGIHIVIEFMPNETAIRRVGYIDGFKMNNSFLYKINKHELILINQAELPIKSKTIIIKKVTKSLLILTTENREEIYIRLK
jgi:hypothetical protein